jgi:hypothetical protein
LRLLSVLERTRKREKERERGKEIHIKEINEIGVRFSSDQTTESAR